MLKLTEHKNGLKMEGFRSLNTSPSINPFCQKMKEIKTCICSQCYGRYMETIYPRARASWIQNFKELTEEKTEALTDEMQVLADSINHKKGKRISGVRIHSVGELFNQNHIQNIFWFAFNINVDIPVTIWTKRTDLLNQAAANIKSMLKDKMINVIRSNPTINTYLNPSLEEDYILHTFNVYDDDQKMHADMYHAHYYQGIKTFECHGSCKDCMVCYPKYQEPMERLMIFELSKKAQGKTGGRKKAI